MEVLDQSVLPQSPHHLILLKYLLTLAYILFVPYISILFGSLAYSLYFKRKFNKSGLENYNLFSKQMIDLVTFNKSVAFALGAVPLLSSAFAYAQLLHTSGAGVSIYLFVSLLLLIIALFFIYTYKYSFHLKDIFKSAHVIQQNNLLNDDLSSYSVKANYLYNLSGKYAVLLLALSVYIFLGSVQLATDSARWNSSSEFLGIIFSLSTLISFLQFIVAAAAITSAYFLYRFFRANSENIIHNQQYKSLIKSFTLSSALIASIILPVLIVANLFFIPIASLSFEYFGITAVIILFILLVSILFYVMIKESIVKYTASIIYLFIALFVLIIIKDQFAFDTSTQLQSVILAKEYDAYAAKIAQDNGTAAPISGADIYNGRCIACHNFDKKIVGPPYKETLPKYEGKKDELVKFILNPVKMNPDYPAMPNQGLKQKEAEAIADYIMTTYKK
jgi:cytochrome c